MIRFLRAIGLLTLVGLVATNSVSPSLAGEQATKVTNLQELKEARTKAAHRKRRIIMNNDGDDVYVDVATREAFLAARTTALLGTQVDSIFYGTAASFGLFTHNTKTGEQFTITSPPPEGVPLENGFTRNKVAEFRKQGTDNLTMIVDFCKQNNLEVFWSMRMNDTHDGWGEWYGPYCTPKLKKDHPEWLVSYQNKRRCGNPTAVDFGREEIRELAFRYLEEVCQNYDVDGIELDFFRHPVFFRSTYAGGEAGDVERKQMTDLVRRVRKMTEEVGLKRGRPILVAVRVPDSVGFCRGMGLDLEAWLKEGLFDVMSASCYFRLNEWEPTVQLAHKYNVPFYPCLSESRIPGEAGDLRNLPETYRARAMEVWNSGADGVYLFNLFDPHSPLWKELGDRQTLTGLDKLYTTGARGPWSKTYWLATGNQYVGRRIVTPVEPRTLAPGKAEVVKLNVFEDFATSPMPALELRLLFDKPLTDENVALKLNGKPLTGGKLEGKWRSFDLQPAQLIYGANHVELTLAKDVPDGTKLEDLLLWVRFKK